MNLQPAKPVESAHLPRRGGMRLADLAALIVGYSLAALGLRAFWPRGEPATLALIVAGTFTYLWLGLALGGPFVLLLDRRRRPGRLGQSRYTGAETAWLLIGGYWMSFIIFFVPVNLIPPSFGLLPIAAAALAWFFGPGLARLLTRRRDTTTAASPRWTHRAALALLITWPIAWASMIALTYSLY